MKKGYEFSNFAVTNIGAYNFDFKKLIRTNTQEVAAILIIAKSKVSGSTYYYAIPKNNMDLLERYYGEIGALDESMTTALAVATARALGGII